MSQEEIPINCIAGLDAYQMEAYKTAVFPPALGSLYCAMGLIGEAGEMGQVILDIIDRRAADDPEFLTEDALTVREALLRAVEAGKVVERLKKAVRKGELSLRAMPELVAEDLSRIRSEGGDSLWYSAVMAEVCGLRLSDVAQSNIRKLRERRDAKVLMSAGETIQERLSNSTPS